MAKNGIPNFFLTIFPKKTGINSEWSKMVVFNFFDSFSQKDWYKFRMAKNGHSKFFLTIFWYKFGMAKMAFQIFFLTIFDNFPKMTGINWYKFRMVKNGWPFFFNFFDSFSQKTGINFSLTKRLEWPKMAVFPKNWFFQIFLTIFPKRLV